MEPTTPIVTSENKQPQQKVKAIYFLLLPLFICIVGVLLFVYLTYNNRQQKQKNYSAILMKHCTIRKECRWSNDTCVCTKTTIEPVLETSTTSSEINLMPTPTITPTPTPLPIATLSATPIASSTPTIVLTKTPTPTDYVVKMPTPIPTATPSATPTPTSAPIGTLSMAVLGESVIQKGLLFTLLDLLFRKDF